MKPREKARKDHTIIYVLFLVLFVAGSWGALYYEQTQSSREYHRLVAEADELLEKQIYDEALSTYQQCLKSQPEDIEVLTKVANLYFATEKYDKAVDTCEKIEGLSPGNVETVLLEAKSYVEKSNYSKAVDVLNRVDGNEQVDQYRKELSGKYYLTYCGVSAVNPWFLSRDGTVLCRVTEQDKAALYTAAGKSYVSAGSSYIGPESDEAELFPALESDVYCFVDKSGSRRQVSDTPYEYLGPYRNGWAVAKKDGVYGFVDTNWNESHFEYTAASNFTEGYAYVQKDGTWYVIDPSFQVVRTCNMTQVLIDSYGFASNYGIVVGQVQEKWQLFTSGGEVVENFSADEIRFPAEPNGLIAFRSGGQWGYVDNTGTIVLEPVYEEAKSFSMGYGAVKVDGKWGYIDTTGTFLVEPIFEDANPVSSAGTAWVANSAGYNLLTFYQFEK